MRNEITTSSQAVASPVIVADDDTAARLAEYKRDAANAFAGNTERAIAADTKIFAAWCSETSRQQLPASPETVRDFIDDMAAGDPTPTQVERWEGKGKARVRVTVTRPARDPKKPATIRRYVASISHMHKAAGFTGSDNPTTHARVTLAMKRTAKERGTRQQQAAGITELHVAVILSHIGSSWIDPRDRALILVARDMLARRSEVVSLDRADITFDDADKTATVLLRRSKTDQTGEGATLYLGPAAAAAVRAWIVAAGIDDGALFRSVHRSGTVGARMDDGEVARIFKRRVGAAGLDASRISGHSARVGMAQDLAQAGASLVDLQNAGRWKSPAMPARYTEGQDAKRGAVARFYQRRASA
jgi:integrase